MFLKTLSKGFGTAQREESEHEASKSNLDQSDILEAAFHDKRVKEMQDEIDDLRAMLAVNFDQNEALQKFTERLKEKDNSIFERDQRIQELATKNNELAKEKKELLQKIDRAGVAKLLEKADEKRKVYAENPDDVDDPTVQI